MLTAWTNGATERQERNPTQGRETWGRHSEPAITGRFILADRQHNREGLKGHVNRLRPQRAIGSTQALRLFEFLAASAWDWLGHARSLRLGFSEDTISDMTALEIARRASTEVGVGRVSKVKERFVGFDWMWIINRPRGRHAIYVVQAKKMRIDQSKGYSYWKLKYPSTPPYQIDVLQAFARHLGAVPLYCFYNNVEGMKLDCFWHCRREKRPSAPQMGCTLVPLDVARLVQDGQIANDFQSIHRQPRAIPWRCLFHPECTNFNFRSVSEGEVGMDVPTHARTRGRGIAEFLAESASDDDSLLDFDDFVHRFDLEEIVKCYIAGARRPMMERTLSIRLED